MYFQSLKNGALRYGPRALGTLGIAGGTTLLVDAARAQQIEQFKRRHLDDPARRLPPEAEHMARTGYAFTDPTQPQDKLHVYKAKPSEGPGWSSKSLLTQESLLAVQPHTESLSQPFQSLQTQAIAAHEGGHSRAYHAQWKDFISVGSSATVAAGMRAGARIHPAMICFAALGTFIATRNAISREQELYADTRAVAAKPKLGSTLQGMVAKTAQPKPTSMLGKARYGMFSTHPHVGRRQENLSQAMRTNPVTLPFDLSYYTAMHDRWKKHGFKDSDISHEGTSNPITREVEQILSGATQKPSSFLNAEEIVALEGLRSMAKIYIDPENEKTLRLFFEIKRREMSPLGDVYRGIKDFDEFVVRLVCKRYASAYLDGNMLRARDIEDPLGKILQDKSGDQAKNRKLLSLIGGKDDTEGLCREYLSLEEIALSSLVLPQACIMPSGDARREALHDEDRDFLHWDMQDSLRNSHNKPILISQPAGVEFRNGSTLHYDLFMIARPAEPNLEWDASLKKVKSSTLSVVARKIYGNKLAYDFQGDQVKDNPDFMSVTAMNGAKWHIYKPAYKEKLKQVYKDILLSADSSIDEHNMPGDAFNLKGLGLGAFSFSHDNDQIEGLAKESLKEVLQEISLKRIKQINLINWPTTLRKVEAETLPTSPMKPLAQFKDLSQRVLVTEGTQHALAKSHATAGEVVATQINGDGASLAGNEANMTKGGTEPGIDFGSDEAATSSNGLSDPGALDPRQNGHLQASLSSTGKKEDHDKPASPGLR